MLDSLYHALGGFSLYLLPALAAPGWLSWRMALAGFTSFAVAGVLRELEQHWLDTPKLNPHRWLEGLSWGLGAALAGLL